MSVMLHRFFNFLLWISLCRVWLTTGVSPGEIHSFSPTDCDSRHCVLCGEHSIVGLPRQAGLP
jgi:hypothetical protein